jgi:hypothetical protein
MHPQIKAHPEAHGIFSTWEEGSPSLLPSLSRRTGEGLEEEEEKRKLQKLCAIYSYNKILYIFCLRLTLCMVFDIFLGCPFIPCSWISRTNFLKPPTNKLLWVLESISTGAQYVTMHSKNEVKKSQNVRV